MLHSKWASGISAYADSAISSLVDQHGHLSLPTFSRPLPILCKLGGFTKSQVFVLFGANICHYGSLSRMGIEVESSSSHFTMSKIRVATSCNKAAARALLGHLEFG